MPKASLQARTLLIWLSAGGIICGSLYYIYQNTGLPLTPQGILGMVGYVPKFTKEDAAESYLRAVCPSNKAVADLAKGLALSNMNDTPDPGLASLAEKLYQANSAAMYALASSEKKWPDNAKTSIHDLIEELKLENSLLYKYQNHGGSVTQITNGNFAKKLQEIFTRANPKPSVLVRMRLGIQNVDC